MKKKNFLLLKKLKNTESAHFWIITVFDLWTL